MPHPHRVLSIAISLLAALAALAASGCAAPAARPFPQDAAQEARIRDIVAHMTLAQKVGQMTQADIRAVTPDDVRRYYIGSVLNGGGAGFARRGR